MKLRVCLMILIGLLIGLHQAVAQSFAPAVDYAAGSLPISVVAADVNGDGKLDLICANGSGNTFTILTNNGSGVFGSNATYHTFPNPESVVAADVNGDGNVDLICACGRLMILTNNGSGGFGLNATLTAASSGVVIAADINGDGKVDLIGANSSSLVVFTNSGNGNFAVASSPGVGSMSVTAADVNGDGKIDLIEANPNILLVLTNDGNGTFSLCSTNALSTHWPGLITTADVNGNGKVDVIVPDYDSGGGNTLTVFTNNGNGGFGSNATYTVGLGPYDVIAADLTGNGKPDLISASFFGNTLTILTNNGSGGFGSNATLNVGSRWVTAADINEDGKLDLITVASTVSILVNTSIFPPPTSTPMLAINPSANSMLVSWPSVSAGWSLQQNSDLTTANWGPSGYSGYSISDDGTNKSLTIPSPTGNLFFRLLHP